MDFNRFAQERNNCYIAEDGFLLWKLTYGSPFVPCTIEGDGDNIIVHILVCDGELCIRHGIDSHTLGPGSFGDFLDRPQLQLLSASSKIIAYIIAAKSSYMDVLLKNNPPLPFSYVLRTRRNPVRMPDKDSFTLFRHRMENIREACMDTFNMFRDKMIKCTIWMLLMDIADRYIRNGGCKDPSGNTDRKMHLFTSFLRMLPEHACTEHFSGFYADRLCVTTQYLNRIVKGISGRTVTGWISFTLTGEISKRLENTDDTMQQIAAQFNFPDQASLTKFYKRETGYSLTEYRKMVKR